jgi:hypothetical protein
MSAKVNIVSIEVKDNPSRFTDEVKLEITFECFDNLQDGLLELAGQPVRIRVCTDLEWKLTYVGSADTSQYDQVLDSILVGPIPEGRHKFMFEVSWSDMWDNYDCRRPLRTLRRYRLRSLSASPCCCFRARTANRSSSPSATMCLLRTMHPKCRRRRHRRHSWTRCVHETVRTSKNITHTARTQHSAH